MDLFEIFNISVVTCPSCGLRSGDKRPCPKCGRDACDNCIAVDNSDCLFCGLDGDIAKECFRALHEKKDS
jgi:hypothetical protein